jgi:hypothetical protein
MIYAQVIDAAVGRPCWVVDGPEVRVGDRLIVSSRAFRVRSITPWNFTGVPQLIPVVGTGARIARWGVVDGVTLGDAGHGWYRILPRTGEPTPGRIWGPR